MLQLILAALFFTGLHFFVAGTGLRGIIVNRIGEIPYRLLFSVMSLAGLIWMIAAYRNAGILRSSTKVVNTISRSHGKWKTLFSHRWTRIFTDIKTECLSVSICGSYFCVLTEDHWSERILAGFDQPGKCQPRNEGCRNAEYIELGTLFGVSPLP